jgi:hypothetical protein
LASAAHHRWHTWAEANRISGLLRPPPIINRTTNLVSGLTGSGVIPQEVAQATAPRPGPILLNTTPAINAESIGEEILGSSNGTKNQRFTLTRAPVLPDVQIEVLEREVRDQDRVADAALPRQARAAGEDHATWVAWQRVESFYGAGAESRWYVLDQAYGIVLFGDGKAGKIPPPGIDNIRAARSRTHHGQIGNVLPRTITELRSTQGPLANVDRVLNREAAGGGYDTETIDRVKRRGPQVIKHRARAVAQEDYQWLALEAPGVARVYPLAVTDARGQFQPGLGDAGDCPGPGAGRQRKETCSVQDFAESGSPICGGTCVGKLERCRCNCRWNSSA